MTDEAKQIIILAVIRELQDWAGDVAIIQRAFRLIAEVWEDGGDHGVPVDQSPVDQILWSARYHLDIARAQMASGSNSGQSVRDCIDLLLDVAEALRGRLHAEGGQS